VGNKSLNEVATELARKLQEAAELAFQLSCRSEGTEANPTAEACYQRIKAAQEPADGLARHFVKQAKA
jgi:hypothetical protein